MLSNELTTKALLYFRDDLCIFKGLSNRYNNLRIISIISGRDFLKTKKYGDKVVIRRPVKFKANPQKF